MGGFVERLRKAGDGEGDGEEAAEARMSGRSQKPRRTSRGRKVMEEGDLTHSIASHVQANHPLQKNAHCRGVRERRRVRGLVL